jgi:rhamnogalacturonyl hydrolase YesR
VAGFVEQAVERLDHWISNSGWRGYDPFDGLSAPLARKLTLEIPALRIALQQTVRRLPVNIRPYLGIMKKRSNQAMGYFASAYLRLYTLSANQDYLDKARYCLADLQEHNSSGCAGDAWGWAFDYQSRGLYLPQGVPTVVWTSFIGHSFVDAYERLADQTYLAVARSVCKFILDDLPRRQINDRSLCISYVPTLSLEIHNSNMLAASLLARVHQHTGEANLLEIARQAVRYTADNQRADGSWHYGEGLRWHWVDGYHTGFVLDSLFWYLRASGDVDYVSNLRRGMDYYRNHLFDGVMPKHFSTAAYPIDIQAVAQAIQTFALIPQEYHGDLAWAEQVAGWAIEQMQDASGYFYFRRHRCLTNKTALLHWGQSTMLAALSLLLYNKQAGQRLNPAREPVRERI